MVNSIVKKMFITTVIIILVFAGFFILNVFEMTQRLHHAQEKIATNEYTHINCNKFNPRFASGGYLGCIKANYAVGSTEIYLAILSFTFMVFLVLKPSIYNLFFIPLIEFIWVFGSEFLVQVFNLTIIHTVPLEGDISLVNSVFRFSNFLIIMLVIGYFAGAFGICSSWGIREIKNNIVKYWLKDKRNLS